MSVTSRKAKVSHGPSVITKMSQLNSMETWTARAECEQGRIAEKGAALKAQLKHFHLRRQAGFNINRDAWLSVVTDIQN
jgi:hypothetical protein